MNCPKCNSVLQHQKSFGIEVDACLNCKGMWLDIDELDTIEDKGYEEDEFKGSLVHREKITEYSCPHCQDKLVEFQYRLNNLHIDYCHENGHGFWLDAGEVEKIIDFMEQREKDIDRKQKAEAEFAKLLKKWRKKSWFRKLLGL